MVPSDLKIVIIYIPSSILSLFTDKLAIRSSITLTLKEILFGYMNY